MASDEDNFSDAEEEEEEEEFDDVDDEDERKLIRYKSYARHLPELQKLVKETFGDSKPNLVTDKTEKCCAICPNAQWFKGWKALHAHAETFKKKKIQQHRGYAEAIKEALRVHGLSTSQREGVQAETRTACFDPEAATNHNIVWPPIVIVEAMEKRAELHEIVADLLKREMPSLCAPRFVHIQSTRGLLIFRGDPIGYLEAKRLSEVLSELKRRRDQSLRVHGDLATCAQMMQIDPQRKLVSWTEENYLLRVRKAHKQDQEEHANEKVQLKEMELQVESLTENERKFKERKERFERLIEYKQKEIENQKKKAEELEQAHHDSMHRLEAQFQNDIKIFEATRAARLKRGREQLQENEKRLEEERIKRMKEIEGLQKQLQTIQQDIKQKEAKKALEKELEVMQRKQNFMTEMVKAETAFNERARKQESELQEKQHAEEMKLMEETKREREKVLQEWLAEQKNEKKEKEQPEQEEVECFLCMDPLDVLNRALFVPCGHARACLECAITIYKEKAQCPLCRQKISRKPTLLSKIFNC